MERLAKLLGVLGLAMMVVTGCNNLPGKPAPDSAQVDPDKILDFAVLYGQNCAGCHGPDGKGGAATPIGDPVYLALVSDSVLEKVTSEGVPGTTMPAFVQSSGGMLTKKQIAVLVKGIRGRWSKPGVLNAENPPPYTLPPGSPAGDATRGASAYETYCVSCHGAGGNGGPKGSSIVNSSYLALVSDQELRTLVIIGRPDFGAPDWRNNVPGKPMSAQDVSDVVAWLAAQRPQYPGQPYPDHLNAKGGAQ
jgi:cytochrome c oxidase cbb3-type subunit III